MAKNTEAHLFQPSRSNWVFPILFSNGMMCDVDHMTGGWDVTKGRLLPKHLKMWSSPT
jgi:hypothetical protein